MEEAMEEAVEGPEPVAAAAPKPRRPRTPRPTPEELREILHLRDVGRLTERQIAKRLDLLPSTVHYRLSRFDASHHRQPSKTRGRPRVTDPASDARIYDLSCADPFRSAADIRDEVDPRISVDTVRNRLREKGLRCRVPARKPFLRAVHVQKRFTFALHHIAWNAQQWQRVVFSDEKIFRSSSRGPLRVYRPVESDRFDPQYLATTTNPKGDFTVNVWAAFGKNFRSMHRVESPTLNSRYYSEIILASIEDHLVRNDLVYMHDLASIHQSRETKAWLRSHNIAVMDDWPPKGADMNPVENLWAELVRRTRNDATNRNQLFENVNAAFQALENAYLDELIASMPRRMAAVMEKRGQYTKY